MRSLVFQQFLKIINTIAWPPRGIYSAIHTGRYIYAETEGDLPELYDLLNDPYQLTNLVNDPEYADILEDLKVRLDQAKE